MISNEERTFVEQLAERLSGEWMARPTEYAMSPHMSLVNTDGARVVVLDGDTERGWADPGRWSFVGLHDGLYDQVKYTRWPSQINIAKSKRPAVIARELQRRLLVAFLEVHADAVANKAARDEKAAAWVRLLNGVAVALGPAVGARVWADESRRSAPEVFSRQVRMEQYCRGEVQLTLFAPSERAIELAELLGLFFAEPAASLQAIA
ncbi:hypothetical protein ACWZHB_01315 [Nocardia sp. FBN12]|uniref:hypothetical protein n=1 Tax=Nocardia sp. FBN12 TaxID=3419766 RepID=UPI003D07839C